MTAWSLIKPTEKRDLKLQPRTSQVVQKMRIRLPRQGIWVQSLVHEDCTRPRQLKHTRCSYWSLHTWSPCSARRETTTVRSLSATRQSWHATPKTQRSTPLFQKKKGTAAISTKLSPLLGADSDGQPTWLVSSRENPHLWVRTETLGVFL